MKDIAPLTRRHLGRLALGGFGAVAAQSVWSQALAANGATVLSITPGTGLPAVDFSDADLMSLPQVSFETTTIWTEGVKTFSGPALTSVLSAAGVEEVGSVIRLTALNDYIVEMDRALIEPAAPIIANRIDGDPFGVRDKGPLWLIFPYDSDDRYRTEVIFGVSVWQLRSIDVV